MFSVIIEIVHCLVLDDIFKLKCIYIFRVFNKFFINFGTPSFYFRPMRQFASFSRNTFKSLS